MVRRGGTFSTNDDPSSSKKRVRRRWRRGPSRRLRQGSSCFENGFQYIHRATGRSAEFGTTSQFLASVQSTGFDQRDPDWHDLHFIFSGVELTPQEVAAAQGAGFYEAYLPWV